MSKIACKCGHIIVDQTDDLPYKGYLIKDTHIEGLYEGFDYIDQLVDAIKANKREEWIVKNFGTEASALELSNSSLIHDLWLRNLKVSTIYTCEKCERLLVQQGEENIYKTYKEEPED